MDFSSSPKWDGALYALFSRADGDEVFIQSQDEKPLNRYFPELIDPLKAQLPARCVLDGEIVIVGKEGLEFETLQMRLHPAESLKKLAGRDIRVHRIALTLLCENDAEALR